MRYAVMRPGGISHRASAVAPIAVDLTLAARSSANRCRPGRREGPRGGSLAGAARDAGMEAQSWWTRPAARCDSLALRLRPKTCVGQTSRTCARLDLAARCERSYGDRNTVGRRSNAGDRRLRGTSSWRGAR